MPKQKDTGKAFEYALINEANNIFGKRGFAINLIKDVTYNTTVGSYNTFNSSTQKRYSEAAMTAIDHIISLEPRLVTPASALDVLTLQLLPDSAGKTGDVRDVLFIRSNQAWEIGISAKNNHMALKHSRLSNTIDFGSEWVNVPCSTIYTKAIAPIFNQLTAFKTQHVKWNAVGNKSTQFYLPILRAFDTELSLINSNNANIPQALLSYLIGRNDFYKVIKRAKVVEILAFNLHGTLGRNIGKLRSVTPIPRLSLPTQIIQSQIETGKKGTLSLICDKGWQLAFRIHSAEKIVNHSLKFDVNLVGKPQSMYSHHIAY